MSSLGIQFVIQGDTRHRLEELLAFVSRHLTVEIALLFAVVLVVIFGKSIFLLTLVAWVSSLWKNLAPAGQQRLTTKLGEAYLRRAKKRSELKTTAALDDIDQAISLLRKALGEEPTRDK